MRAHAAGTPGATWPHLAKELRWAGWPQRATQALRSALGGLGDIHFHHTRQHPEPLRWRGGVSKAEETPSAHLPSSGGALLAPCSLASPGGGGLAHTGTLVHITKVPPEVTAYRRAPLCVV